MGKKDQEGALALCCPKCGARYRIFCERIEGMEEPKFRCRRCQHVFRLDEEGVQGMGPIWPVRMMKKAQQLHLPAAALGSLALTGAFLSGMAIGTPRGVPHCEISPAIDTGQEIAESTAGRSQAAAELLHMSEQLEVPRAMIAANAAVKAVQPGAQPGKTGQERAAAKTVVEAAPAPKAVQSESKAEISAAPTPDARRLPAVQRKPLEKAKKRMLFESRERILIALNEMDANQAELKISGIQNKRNAFTLSELSGPSRLVVDVTGVRLPRSRNVELAANNLVKRVRLGPHGDSARVVLDLKDGVKVKTGKDGKSLPLTLVMSSSGAS